MKGFGLKGSLALLAMTFFLLLGPGRGQAQEEVIIQGEKLPSNILEVINAELGNTSNPGVQEVHFRNLTLTNDEAAGLFLSTDLKALGDTLKDGQQVRFRGTVDSQPFEARVEQHEDGLRARIEGIDVSGITPQQFADLATNNGFDRLRIRGTNGERYEIKRRDDGMLQAEIRGMDVSGYTPEQLTNLAKERGLDRVRIRGVDKDGNRIRIEYRQDKGIVKWEGAGRGVTEVSRQLNNLEHARDRGRDRENKLRDDHRGRGRERIERSLRERTESHVRERVERHGGSGRH